MANTYTNLTYHVIFSTKERLPLIIPSLQKKLYDYIGGIIRAEQGSMLKIGGMPDHIHIGAQFRADISVSEMLRKIKGASSKWVNEQKPQKIKFQWQRGYGAFAVSQSQTEFLLSYIDNQAMHHRKKSFQEEYVEFLKKQNIEFDARYLWNAPYGARIIGHG